MGTACLFPEQRLLYRNILSTVRDCTLVPVFVCRPTSNQASGKSVSYSVLQKYRHCMPCGLQTIWLSHKELELSIIKHMTFLVGFD